MFDHVTIRVGDLDASRHFYELALGRPTHVSEYVEWGSFGITPGGDVTRRLHAGFGVEDRAAVDAWWRKMTSAGYESDGEPGPRPQYSASYYGAFVLDPDGNSVEAVTHDSSRPGLDHLWLRTPDVGAQRRFWQVVGEVVGLRVRDVEDRINISDGRGSFSYVPGDEPTHNVHLACGVDDVGTVESFHRAATEAGHRDNGPPGERPQYHPGYWGAFVLDPDGHNVEAVFHDRR
jgi:catechol 2,3-dioxygenase-like lactoylglutathione lyase family enzyme